MLYYTDREISELTLPAGPPIKEPWANEPEYLRCRLPAECELTSNKARKLGALVMQFQDISIGSGETLGYTEMIRHKIDPGDAAPLKPSYYRRSQKEHEYVDTEFTRRGVSFVYT